MKNEWGVSKVVDKNGRVVIPADIRKRYGLDGEVEIIPMENGVLVRSPKYVLRRKPEKNKRT